MSDPEQTPAKSPSLMDYVVRYDLKTMIEEARLDYSAASSGSPRHLAQKDITARFRAKKKKTAPSNDSSA